MNYAAEELGFNTLGRLFDAVPNFQAAAIVVRRSWAENNRAVGPLHESDGAVPPLASRQSRRRR
jgi:hypothetical protein